MNRSQLQDSALLRTQAYIDGQWRDADDARTIPVHDPATGALLGAVPCMGGAETRVAVAAASAALGPWRSLLAKQRAALLRRWHDLIMQHADDLAAIMTAEQGKPLSEARAEVVYAASYIEWYAEEAKRAYGDLIPATLPGRQLQVTREPIGVCAAITPWNFPSAMITRKAGPALAAGCTMIVKPSELTPFSALALAELAHRAGIPPGVLNVVTGRSSEIGAEFTSNPAVRKLSFTGSTRVGKLLMAQAASTVKKVSLELGGNAPFIVFDDADLDAAVEGALVSKFRNAGQTCVCANRLYVQAGIYERFAARLVDAVAQLKVANGFEPESRIGPLIGQTAIDKVEDHIANAVHLGARVRLGGRRHTLGGHFFEPTVVTGATQAMRIAQEETFGPVAALIRFDTEQEVVAMANDTEYGLASYVYTRDIGRVHRVAEQLEYGMVGINTGVISTEVAPFGGVKQSGIGREGSRYGMDEYQQLKYRCVAGL